jgi:hypothetical protein
LTVPTQTGVLARTQRLVQNSRGIPNAAHRTFGRFSEVGTESFLAAGQFAWTALPPREKCGIRVGDQTRHWTEGRSLVFDDTYEHEAWNDTDGERVVLFLDIKRPLRPPMNRINDGVIKAVSKSPFIKNARAQHLAREERFTAAWNAVVGAPGSAPVSRYG